MLELDRRVFTLLERLHEAPGDAPAWLQFLEALRAEISPDAVALFASQAHENRPGVIAGTDIGLRLTQPGDFLPSMPHPDPAAAPVGSVHELPEDGEFQSSSLFQEVLEPAGIQPGPGLLVVTERSERHVKAVTMLLPRSPSWKPTATDRVLLARLAPHMVIARRMHVRLIERGRDAEALAAAFDHLVLGVILLDQRQRVSYANLSAAEILGVTPGFAPRAVLAAEAPDERTRACEQLIRREHSGERDALVYAHPKDGRPLQVLATPFGWRSGQAIGGARFSRALFIGDPKRRAGDPIGVLHGLYGLTRSETRLAMLLLGGYSVEEAAQLLGISVGTVRGVLKKVFDKTGTNRQASLVRLLLTGFGQVRQKEVTEPPPPAPTSRHTLRRRASA
jgi:DNA-binding CsgD family transcriptional regulator